MSEESAQQRARNMQLFNADLEVLMDQINGMLAHYQISDWEAYVFFRKRACPDSYALKYEAAAGDEFAQKIVNLHRQGDTPEQAAPRSRSKKQKVEESLRESDLTAQLAERDNIVYGHHDSLPRGEHVARPRKSALNAQERNEVDG